MSSSLVRHPYQCVQRRFQRRLANGSVLLLIILAGIFSTPVHAQAENPGRAEENAIKDREREQKLQEFLHEREEVENAALAQPMSEEDLEKKHLVEIETNNVLPSDLVSTYVLVPYRLRRPTWGHLVSLTYSMFNPVNYQSDYAISGLDFKSMYGSAQTPLIELSYEYKRNMALGSIGVDVGYGNYSNDAEEPAAGNARLNLQMARIGGKYIADNLFVEPRIAPYVIGGAYEVFYKETQANKTFSGTTAVAYYYGAGLMLQLGWLDPSAAVDSYTESGIENTYIFAEARQYMASNGAKDPDFSTNVDFNFGLSLEF